MEPDAFLQMLENGHGGNSFQGQIRTSIAGYLTMIRDLTAQYSSWGKEDWHEIAQELLKCVSHYQDLEEMLKAHAKKCEVMQMIKSWERSNSKEECMICMEQ